MLERRDDRRGSVGIGDGRVALHKRNGELIAEAPLTEVRAAKMKSAAGAAARV